MLYFKVDDCIAYCVFHEHKGCGFVKAAAKQSFSLFLCLVMLAGLFPGVSHAEDARNQPEMETSADTRVQASDTLGQVFANSLDLSGDLTGGTLPGNISRTNA